MMFCATPSSAQDKSLKDALVGHWQLVSVSVSGRSPYGANPHGSMFLDAAGHFSVIVVSDGNARSLAYFGTYTINDADKSLVIHIEDSAGGGSPNAAGRDLKRLVTLSGDELAVENELATGGPGAVKVIWKRAN
jgi:Lipocalin-like domain